ncbi:MAG: GDSL-type esterase/lipase family protein [Eubacterium sp.]
MVISMGRFKKVLCLQMIIVLSAAAITACADHKDENTQEDGTSLAETTTEEITAAAKEKYTVYVALGDSIAHGYGLTNLKKQRYSRILANDITSKQDSVCEDFNYGIDGQTSTELIKYINAGKARKLAQADLITISIGANNVLSEVEDFSKTYMKYHSETLTGSTTGISQEDVSNSYNEFLNKAAQGIAVFETDIPDIINSIRSINDNAVIIFQTIYNPYANVNIPLEVNGTTAQLSKITDGLVTKLNKIIINNKDVCGYKVADVYTAFSVQSDKLVNVEESSQNSLTSLDPHPNRAGHLIISNTIYNTLYNEQEEC